MFVNKVLLGQSHSHLYTCCLVVTETGHPTKPKIFTTQPFTGKAGGHPVWITLYCFKLWRCFCLPEPLSPRSLEPAGASCPELPCKNASARQVVRTCWLVSCPARLWTRAQSFLSPPPLSSDAVEFPQRHDHAEGGGRPGSRLHSCGETRRGHALLRPGLGGGEPLCTGPKKGCYLGREEALSKPPSLHLLFDGAVL